MGARLHYPLLAYLCFLLIPSPTWAQKKCPKAESLSASDIGDHSALLSWTGGDEVITYQISVKHGQGTSHYNFDASTEETSLAVDGLSAGSKYRFQVKTKCDKGSGGASQWFEFTTTGDPSTLEDSTYAPKGPCPKASNLAVLEVTDSSVLLTWLGNPENVSYQVDVHQKEFTPRFRLSEVVDTSVLAVDGLEPGGNYKFRVKSKCAKNSGGSSSWINFSTTGGDSTFTHCPKPSNLSVLEVTDSSALLTWIAKDSASSFELTVKSFQQTPSFSLVEMLEDTFKLVESLAPDGDYQFRVVATCTDGGTSGSSDWSKFRTLPEEEVADTSGAADTTTAEALAISTFPNPASREFAFELPVQDTTTEIVISDVNGRVVYHERIAEGVLPDTFVVPVDALIDGIYKLVITSGSTRLTNTILVQH